MANFILSAFADEIDMDLDVQLETLTLHGIDHIEVRGIYDKNVAKFSTDEANSFKKKMDEKGFLVSSIGSPVGKIDIKDDYSKHIELYKHILEMASVFGATYIRVFSFYYPTGDDPYQYKNEVISRLGEMTEMAKKRSITLLHENEKDVYGDLPDRCLDILKGVNSPNLRAIFDAANFVQCGVEAYPDAFDQMKEYVEYLHIKDAVRTTGKVVPAGHGDGHIYEILRDLKKIGFDGILSIEPHLGYFKGFENFEKNINSNENRKGARDSFAEAVNALKDILNRL